MVKNSELHGGFNYMVTIEERRPWLNVFKEVRVVAHLLELHEHIEELDPVFSHH